MRRYLPSQKWRDLGIMAVILLLMWIPAAEFEAFEWLHTFTRAHETWELDEVILIVLLMPMPLAWYAVRRAREATRLAQRALENERDLSHARKIDSLGTLAGGLAHELNNQLQPLVGLSELLEAETPQDDPRRRQVELIYAGSLKARESVDRVLRFARREAAGFVVPDTSEAMRSLVELMRLSCPTTVKMTVSLADDLPPLDMAWADVESIVMNLFSNAVAAMDGAPGQLDIRLHLPSVPNPNGHAAVLTVSDTGPGISEALQQRIFDPYFTSKPLGAGTGLGLWQVQALLRAAGGRIEVQSELGRGTEMQVWLPAAGAGASAQHVAEVG
ncbi:MAG: ATP-binding protein [Pseudomonadota bacterium]|nr:ATP-binding protein [Pseudomonadota bacterium]MEC8293731.1 ATP-binding protein [Pseudomonadota bacterium]